MSIVKTIILNFSDAFTNVLNCSVNLYIPFLVHKIRVVNQYTIMQQPDCEMILYSDLLERPNTPFTLLREGIQLNPITHYYQNPKHISGNYNFKVNLNNSDKDNNTFDVHLEVEFYSHYHLYDHLRPTQSKNIVWRVGAGDVMNSIKNIDIEFPVDEIIISQSIHDFSPTDAYLYYRGFYSDLLNSSTILGYGDPSQVATQIQTNISPMGHYSQHIDLCTNNPIIYTYSTGQIINGSYKIWTVKFDNTPIDNINSCFFLTFNSYK